MTPFHCQPAADAHKNAPEIAAPEAPQPLRRCRRVTEPAMLQAIDKWLRGGAWTCEDAAYNPYHGYHIRLRERGDELVMLRSKRETVETAAAVVSRNPVRTLPGPDGAGATMHSEARALCELATKSASACSNREPDGRRLPPSIA